MCTHLVCDHQLHSAWAKCGGTRVNAACLDFFTRVYRLRDLQRIPNLVCLTITRYILLEQQDAHPGCRVLCRENCA